MNLDRLRQGHDQAKANRKAPPPPPRSRLVVAPTGEGYELDPILLEDAGIKFVLQSDERHKKTIELLRERKSLLIIDPDRIDQQEQEAAAELFPAMAEAARLQQVEDTLEQAWKRIQNEAVVHIGAAKIGYPSSGVKTKSPGITALKAEASTCDAVIEAHEAFLQAQYERRLADAYVKALQVKYTMVPGCQGARNRGYC